MRKRIKAKAPLLDESVLSQCESALRKGESAYEEVIVVSTYCEDDAIVAWVATYVW